MSAGRAVHVHIDGIIFSLQNQGGISVLFRELLTRLERSGIGICLSLEQPLRQVVAQATGGDLQVVKLRARLGERYRPCRAPGAPMNVFHSSYYRQSANRQVASVVTVHDFAYERCVGGMRSTIHTLQKNAAIRQARAIICVSESTRTDLLELVGVRSDQQVFVVHNGVSEFFAPAPDSPMLESQRPYMLFVGQRARYKNFKLAASALDSLPGMELHCVGGGPLRPSELDSVAPGSRCRIRHWGAASQAQLHALYTGAVCLVYPSSYEGFGIPVLEAMRSGCPVVALASPGVLEVGGDALALAQPNGESVADAVRGLMEPARRERVRATGLARAAMFSWQRNFEQTTQIYRAVAS